MNADFIDGEVLYTSQQIADRIGQLREMFGVGKYLTASQIADALKITKSRSSLTMIGHAMRTDDRIVPKRTAKHRLFVLR